MKKQLLPLLIILASVTFLQSQTPSADVKITVVQQTQTLNPTPCGTVSYDITIKNTSGGTITAADVTLAFNANTISSCTISNEPSSATTSITGSPFLNSFTLLPNESLNNDDSYTFTYTLTIACGGIPIGPNRDANGVYLAQFIAHTISCNTTYTCDITTNSSHMVLTNVIAANATTNVTTQIDFPLLNPSNTALVNIAGHPISGSSSLTTVDIPYINTGNAPFEGAIQVIVDEDVACTSKGIPTGIEILDGTTNNSLYTSSSAPSVSTVGSTSSYTFTAADISSTAITSGNQIIIRLTFNILDCIDPNNTCGGHIKLNYGCTTTDVCRNTTAIPYKLVKDSYKAYLGWWRNTPVATAIPSGNNNQFEWDASAMNSETGDWSYTVQNINGTIANTAPAENVMIKLKNYDPTSYTFIRAGSITCYKSSAPTTPILLTTTPLDISNFTSLLNGNATPPCFTDLDNLHSGASSNLVSQVIFNIGTLAPNETVTFTFKTFRCCPGNVQPYNTGVNFNRWGINVNWDRFCEPTSAPENRVTFITGPNHYKPVYLPSNGIPAISSDYADNNNTDPDLFLTPEVLTSPSLLKGATPDETEQYACGTYSHYVIQNNGFQTLTETSSQQSVIGFDEQLFCSSPTTNNGGINVTGPTGLNPQGKFKIILNVDPNLSVDQSSLKIVLQPLAPATTTSNWTPSSVSASTFVWCTPQTIEAVFDIADISTGTSFTGQQFKSMFINSTIEFDMKSCCNLCTNGAYTGLQQCVVNTLFAPNPAGCAPATCTECYIPLSSVVLPVTVTCPGCSRPGVAINDLTVERTTLGYYDSDDDGAADYSGAGNGLLPIIYTAPDQPSGNSYAKYNNMKRFKSIIGDEVLTHTVARFQDGDYSDPNGFSYSQWISKWGTHFSHLYAEQIIKGLYQSNLSIVSATFTIKQTIGGAVSTYNLPLSSLNVLRNDGTVVVASMPTVSHTNLFRIDADDLVNLGLGFSDFNANDIYTLDVKYKICDNPTANTDFTVEEYMYFGTQLFSDNSPILNSANTQVMDLPDPTGTGNDKAAVADPDDNIIYFCEGSGLVSHTIIPVTTYYRENAGGPISSCRVTLNATIGYQIGSGNEFSYEYRFVPGVDPTNYINGLSLSSSSPNTFTFTPPAGYPLNSPASIIGYSNYHPGGVITMFTHRVLETPGNNAVSNTGNSYYINTANTVFEPLLENTSGTLLNAVFTTNSQAAMSPGLHGTKNVLISGDEMFRETLTVNLEPECPTTPEPLSLSSIYVTIPDLDCDGGEHIHGDDYSFSGSQYIYTASVMTGTNIFVGPYSNASLAAPEVLTSGPSQTDLVFHCITFFNHLDLPFAYMYFDLDDLPSCLSPDFIFVDPSGISSNPVEATETRTVTSGVHTYKIFQFANLSKQVKFDLHIPYLGGGACNCPSNMELPITYGFDCDDFLPANTTIPPTDVCTSSNKTFTLNYTFPSASPQINCTIPTTYSNCSPITLSSSLNNTGTGGLFDISASISLPASVTVNAAYAKFTINGTQEGATLVNLPTTVTTASGVSTYNYDLSALNGTSYAGLNGLAATGSSVEGVTIYLSVTPNCDNVLQDIDLDNAFTFSGQTFCQEDFSTYCNSTFIIHPYDENAETGCIAVTLNHTDPTCTDSTGSISVNSPLSNCTYTLTKPDGTTATGTSFSSLPSGLYTVTATSTTSGVTSCGYAQYQIPPYYGFTVGVNAIKPTCLGGSNGKITLTPLPAGNYTYSWSHNMSLNNNEAENLASGTYEVDVTNSNGSCTVTKTITLNAGGTTTHPNLSNTYVTNVSCNGASNGTIVIVPFFSNYVSGTYTYNWSSTLATGNNPSNLPAGSYSVTVTDDRECTATEVVNVTEPAPIVLSSSIANTSCSNSIPGSIDLSVTGGTLSYSYLWSNAANTEDIYNIIPNTYTVTVTDANSCSATLSNVVNNGGALALTLTSSDVMCNGKKTGTIICAVTGNSPTYVFDWSNGSNTQNQIGLYAGTYTVTVTEKAVCTVTASATINEPDVLNISTSVSNVSCYNGYDGSINIDITGGVAAYTYEWSNYATTEDIANLTPNNYNVTVTDDNGCTATAIVTVSEPNTSLSIGLTVVDEGCSGNSVSLQNGSIDANVVGGTSSYTYAWSNSGTGASINSLSAGSYTLTVTDNNGCTATATTDVNQLSCPCGVSNFALGCHICEPINIPLGTTPETYEQGYQQFWRFSFQYSGVSTPLTVTTTNPDCDILYYAPTNVFNGDNEVLVVTKNVANIPNTSATFLFSIGDVNIVCEAEYIADLECSSPLTACSNSNIEPENWVVTCNGTDVVTGRPKYLLNLDFKNYTSQTINGGLIDCDHCTAQAFYTDDYDPGNTDVSIAIVPDDANATQACLTYLFNDLGVSCSACKVDFCVDLPAPLTANITVVQNDCEVGPNGELTATVTGGTAPYAYNWSAPTFVPMGGATISNLPNTFYNLTVTDHNECTATATATVGYDTYCPCGISNVTLDCSFCEPQMALGTDIHIYTISFDYSGASNSNVTFSTTGNTIVTGSTTDQVNNGANTILVITNNPSNTSATTDLLTLTVVEDGSNDVCSVVIPISLLCTSNEQLPICSSSDYTISNVSTSCLGFAGNGSREYSASMSFSNNLSTDRLLGVIKCEGCTYSEFSNVMTPGTQTININSIILDDPDATNICFTCGWVPDGLCAECKVEICLQLPTFPTASTSLTQVDCNSSNVDLSVSAGTSPYSYSWNNSATTQDLSSVAAGLYAVTITDADNCVASASAQVAQGVSATAQIQDACNTNDGSIDLTVSGSAAQPCTFAWSNSSTTEDLSNIISGTYTVIITDDNGCTGIYTYLIADITCKQGNDISFNEASDNKITIIPNPTDGNAKIRYSLNKGEHAIFMLYDITGKIVFEKELFNERGTESLRMKGLQKSVYTYKVVGNKSSIYSGKLIIVN